MTLAPRRSTFVDPGRPALFAPDPGGESCILPPPPLARAGQVGFSPPTREAQGMPAAACIRLYRRCMLPPSRLRLLVPPSFPRGGRPAQARAGPPVARRACAGTRPDRTGTVRARDPVSAAVHTLLLTHTSYELTTHSVSSPKPPPPFSFTLACRYC